MSENSNAQQTKKDPELNKLQKELQQKEKRLKKLEQKKPTEAEQRRRGQLIFGLILAVLIITVAGWVGLHLGSPPQGESKAGLEWVGPYPQPPLQWVDWLLLSFAGVLVYCMGNAAHFLRPERPVLFHGRKHDPFPHRSAGR